MKAYLIARVSTDEQSDALPGQVYRLEDYAKKKNLNYELFQFKESAYKGKRKSLIQIIQRINASTEKVIVVFDKIDRYTRDTNSDECMVLNGLCRIGSIELHFPSDNLFIHKNSSAQEKFMLNVGASNAQYYSDSSADNVNRRIQQKLRDGECIGKVPIGYKNIRRPDGRSDVIIEPFMAEAVKEAFELYSKGIASLLEIKRMWAEDYGIKREKNAIAKLMHNPFYAGFIHHEGKLYPHKYEKIISKNLFDQVQEQFDGYKNQKRRWAGIDFEYRNIIKCAECGSTITFERHKEKYVYGKCTSKYGTHPTAYVPIKVFDDYFMYALNNIKIPDDVVEQVRGVLSKEINERTKHKKEIATTLNAEIKKYQNRKEQMYLDKLDGNISEELYKKNYDEFTSKEQKLRERLENLELDQENRMSDISHLLELANKAHELFKKADNLKKREITKLVFSNLLLQQRQLRWEYKKPFDTMASCNKTNSWCGLGDSNSWPLPWQGSALTTELNPHGISTVTK